MARRQFREPHEETSFGPELIDVNVHVDFFRHEFSGGEFDERLGDRGFVFHHRKRTAIGGEFTAAREEGTEERKETKGHEEDPIMDVFQFHVGEFMGGNGREFIEFFSFHERLDEFAEKHHHFFS